MRAGFQGMLVRDCVDSEVLGQEEAMVWIKLSICPMSLFKGEIISIWVHWDDRGIVV